jgi:hypothetical protein
MSEIIHQRLEMIRRRQLVGLLVRLSGLGLLISSAMVVFLELGRHLFHWPLLPMISGFLLALGPAVGVLAGLISRPSLAAAARAADGQSGMKDRASTALAFLRKPQPTLLHQLTVGDAAQHLAGVHPPAVAPLCWPRALSYALLVSALALALMAWPAAQPKASAAPAPPIPEIVREAERVEEQIKEFEKLLRDEPNKPVEDLVRDLRKKADEMKQPGIEVKDAMAKLSEMQAAIQKMQAQFNLDLVDKQLRDLGTAMSSVPALEPAGKALQDTRYHKAAAELEKLEDPQIDPRDGRTAERKMQQAAKEMEKAGLSKLSAATSRMAEGIKNHSEGGGKQGKEQLQEGAMQVAKQVRQQERRRRISQLLAMQQENLKECKNRCQTYQRDIFNKQSSSEGSAGTPAAAAQDQLFGEKSTLPHQRNRQELKGTQGEGSSQFETTQGQEGEQQATREEMEKYVKYRRLSDTVLESELIPLRHRLVVRRYFELIRPAEKAEGGK